MLRPAPGWTKLPTMRPTIERQRREGEEVGERLAGDAADLLQVRHAGDAGDHGQEDHRRDDHLDQLDEGVAERLQAGADVGPEVADGDAEDDRGQHLDIELAVEGLRRVGLGAGGVTGDLHVVSSVFGASSGSWPAQWPAPTTAASAVPASCRAGRRNRLFRQWLGSGRRAATVCGFPHASRYRRVRQSALSWRRGRARPMAMYAAARQARALGRGAARARRWRSPCSPRRVLGAGRLAQRRADRRARRPRRRGAAPRHGLARGGDREAAAGADACWRATRR